MYTIKVFQLAKTCSEIIGSDIFRPDACGVMFVCNWMDRGYEHVRSCGETLEKKIKTAVKRLSQLYLVLVYSNGKRELKQTTMPMTKATAARTSPRKGDNEQNNGCARALLTRSEMTTRFEHPLKNVNCYVYFLPNLLLNRLPVLHL